ncbi:MAG: YdcF family protein [Chloroflexi bacterium]|nr:YdcF family protein [Chloroflexota bacterium]
MSYLGRLVLGALLASIAVSGWATYRIMAQGGIDEQRPADAIVVLGAAQYDGRPSPVLEARVAHAVELFRAGVAPILIVTGGKASGDRTTEAAAARTWAVEHGVPAGAILAEDQGRTTLESIEAVAGILRARRLTSAVFVSDRSHMLRVLRIAIDQGILAWGSPTATSPSDADPGSRASAVIHELGALAIYFAGAGRTVVEQPVAATP